MPWFYLILVWLHLLAATFYVGGMLFLSVVAVPLLRTEPDRAESQRRFLSMARRFRSFSWGAIVILLFTGTVLLRGHVSFGESFSDWPGTVLIKLLFVGLLLATSISHEFYFGRKVSALKQQPPSSWSPAERTLVQFSPWLSRSALLLGLVIFFLGAVLSRY